MSDDQTRTVAALVGLAVGDAVGTTLEFKPRGSFEPITDMIGGGPFNLDAGQWTDDTSMALCLAVSLLECKGFDADDQMQRYLRWRTEGYLSSNGRCFDIGNTCSDALARFQRDGKAFAGSTAPHAAGNGSVMRLAPVAMYYAPDHDAAVHYAGESSKTTHGAPECVDACRLFAAMICRAIDGKDKDEILCADAASFEGEPKVAALARASYRDKSIDEIDGSGYVIAGLEAALWCFDRSNSFEEAILASANLGGDTDTTAAICGQIAGPFYGLDRVPSGWLRKLCMRDKIIALGRRMAAAGVA